MEQELRILHVEIEPADSRIVAEKLRQEGFRAEIDRVETLEEYAKALRDGNGNYSLIISGYLFHSMDPLEALRLAREQRPELPFIFLSGTLGEEQAIECLKLGATDYVLKQRISRLVPAVRRALEQSHEQARLKQAEAELRQSEARFRSFVEATNQVVWRTDAHGQVDQSIPSWNAFTGQTDEEAAGFGWMSAIHPEDRPVVVEAWRRSSAARALYEVEYRLRTADGRWRRVLARGIPILQADGAVQEFIGTCMDITERKNAEEGLRESERRLRKAVSSPTVGVLFFNLNGSIYDANETFQRMSGYNLEELRHFHWKTLTAPEGWEDTLQAATDLASRGETAPYEKPMIRKDGSRWFGLFAPVRLSGIGSDSECMEFIVDITDRRHAEAALERRTLHLQILHHAATQLLVGQSPVDLLRELHPRIAQAFGADVFMLYQSSPGNSHLSLKECAGLSGEERQKIGALCYGRAVCVKPDEALQPIIACHVQTREAPGHRFIRKLGFRSYLYYPLILNNRLHGTFAFASRSRDKYDSTDLDFFHTVATTLAEALERENLKSELQSHAASLERTVQERTATLQETIAELEQMSYSMIHDLRAPLRAIQSFSSLIQEDPKNHLTDESRQLLELIGNSTNRMDHLVRDVLNYARVIRDDLPLGPVDIGALALGIVESYPELSRAEVEIAPDLPAVQANSAALTQCLSQLFNNAVRFAKPGITPHIRLRVEEKSNGWMRLLVEDNGIGISPQLQTRIFGMFQQIRNTGQGTGMGLAIVKKAVERMGGRVGVESEPGKGSRFWIELKAAVPADPQKPFSHSE